MAKLNVLILCTGNSCRNILAEAMLKKHAGDRFNVFSAGLDPKGVHPTTLQVLEEVGIDTSDLESTHVEKYLGHQYIHYLIVVCHHAQQYCPSVFPGIIERYFWPFEDPPAFEGSEEEKLNKFREVRDKIEERMVQWLIELDTAGEPRSQSSVA
jgi:arsenate reductase